MLKSLLLPYLPRWLISARRRFASKQIDKRFLGQSPREVFSHIYKNGLWGQRAAFYSGTGSHDPEIVGPYVSSVREYLSKLPYVPDVVDLGCGDFNVGNQIRDMCGKYIACDVVPELIEQNRRLFTDSKVEFQTLDIVADPLPPGDIAFVRQVLQHLSNAQIAAVIPKLLAVYRILIVTEHLAKGARQRPNEDKPTGPGNRSIYGSGVILASPPFSITAKHYHTLCSVPAQGAFIETVAYKFD